MNKCWCRAGVHEGVREGRYGALSPISPLNEGDPYYQPLSSIPPVHCDFVCPRAESLFFYHPGLKEISNITMDWKNTNLPPVAVMTVWSGDPLASLGMLRVFWGGDSWDMGGSIILNGIPNHYWGQMSHSKRI